MKLETAPARDDVQLHHEPVCHKHKQIRKEIPGAMAGHHSGHSLYFLFENILYGASETAGNKVLLEQGPEV